MMRTARVLVTALILAFFSPVLAAEVVDAGMPAPEWEMSDSEGREIAFPAVTQGRPGILFFWASWCPYCHVVMPYLQSIVDDYADHGLQVFAINFKDDGDPAAYMEEHGYDFVVLPLGDLVADDYGVISSPGLLVVDGEGMVTYRRRPTRAPPGMAIAEVWDQQLREALDRILNRPADE